MMQELELVFRIVAGLVGFPALVAVGINLAKYFGWLSDGSAPKANFVLHLLAYVGVAVAVFFGKVDILPGLDMQLGALANVLLSVLAFLSSLGVARGYNAALRGVPFVGYSHN